MQNVKSVITQCEMSHNYLGLVKKFDKEVGPVPRILEL